jgi:hypothetical protein
MSLGHPGESVATIHETQRWLVDEHPDDFDITVITPYPGSPYYDDAAQENGTWFYTARSGDRLYQDEVDYTLEADYYKGAPDGGYVSHVWTDYLTKRELVQWRDDLERDLRETLRIPFNPSAPAMLYEHSMGQLPAHILRINQ